MKHLSYSDQELLDLLKKDDRNAFEMIYFRYWEMSFQVAYKILQDIPASEDAVQEVFVEIWLKRNKAIILNLKSYIFQSIRFQVFKIIRHNKVIAAHVERDFILNFSTNDGEDNLVLNDIKQILDEAVAKLPEKCRQIFNLSRNKHMSTKEIAAVLDLSPKTVDNQLNIALKKIKASMASSFVLVEVIIAVYSGR
ncbi:RNA polymerase sigma-70 factor [Pedobacter rhizosphaerae]|uniref:RNA polymerase sigma-70 factor, ECF subfamily n=1 Tax=Pedobacter rhizosphaerae TaxID=390241 RepID=A0A1H9R4T5_9SPHI|nr:RNA polymerase sigma-70 factor [Pedobacter rhizosphaerae]SER67059.1 RNA polymerase sigma-70 factor, ECF subfamily [Pedobacter rhizosphaerae]